MAHTFLTDNIWVNAIILIGLFGGALASVKRWIVDPIVTVFGRIADLFEDVYGEPARQGVEQTPGLMQRMDRVERHIWPRHEA